jgi:hypothetical protein
MEWITLEKIKIKKLKIYIYFFPEKILRTKQTMENTGKFFLEFFFSKMEPNIVKYFPFPFLKIILLKIFYGETNRP